MRRLTSSKVKILMKGTREVLSDPALMQQISESRAFYRTGKKGLSFEDVFGEPVTPAKKYRHQPAAKELTVRLRKKS